MTEQQDGRRGVLREEGGGEGEGNRKGGGTRQKANKGWEDRTGRRELRAKGPGQCRRWGMTEGRGIRTLGPLTLSAWWTMGGMAGERSSGETMEPLIISSAAPFITSSISASAPPPPPPPPDVLLLFGVGSSPRGEKAKPLRASASALSPMALGETATLPTPKAPCLRGDAKAKRICFLATRPLEGSWDVRRPFLGDKLAGGASLQSS